MMPICANLNCPNYNEEAERILQFCCDACRPNPGNSAATKTLCNKCGTYACICNTYQAPGHPPQIDIGNGRTTKAPDYHLIPAEALRRLAARFSLGEIRKGDKAWNALSKYQDVLTNESFIVERINHVIDHAYKLLSEINSGVFGVDDNAAALAWAGIFLISATKELGYASGEATVPIQSTPTSTGDADFAVFERILEAMQNHRDGCISFAATRLHTELSSTRSTDQPVSSTAEVVRD